MKSQNLETEINDHIYNPLRFNGITSGHLKLYPICIILH